MSGWHMHNRFELISLFNYTVCVYRIYVITLSDYNRGNGGKIVIN